MQVRVRGEKDRSMLLHAAAYSIDFFFPASLSKVLMGDDAASESW